MTDNLNLVSTIGRKLSLKIVYKTLHTPMFENQLKFLF